MSIRYDVEQGSAEWLELRLGLPTASNFDQIITPKTAKFSAQSRKYAFKLVAEKLLNRSLDAIETLEWVEHGRMLEPEAIRAYEFEHEAKTEAVGFIVTDDGRFGCSPDRLIGERGLLEVKCPAPQTMVSYLVDGYDQGYQAQVQGQLFVSERDYVDWLAYSAEMPRVLVRTYRDDAYIALLADALNQFDDMLQEMMGKVRAQGFFNAQRRVRTAADDLIDELDAGEIAVAGERFFNG